MAYAEFADSRERPNSPHAQVFSPLPFFLLPINETESSKSIFNVNGSEIIGQSSGRLALRSAYRTTKASQTRSHSFSERGLLISGNPARNASAIVSTDHGFPFVRPISRNTDSRVPKLRDPDGNPSRGSASFAAATAGSRRPLTDDLSAVSSAAAPISRRWGPTSLRSIGAGDGCRTTFRPDRSTFAFGYTADTICIVSRTVWRKRLLSASLPRCLASWSHEITWPLSDPIRGKR